MPTVRRPFRENSHSYDTRTHAGHNTGKSGSDAEKPAQHFMTGLLIFNLIIGVLTACLVIHLGIENSRRATENEILLNELDRLRPNSTNAFQPQQDSPFATSLRLDDDLRESPCCILAREALKIVTEVKNSTMTSLPWKDSVSPHRYFRNKLNAMLNSIRALESSQIFFRKQIHQRLGALESKRMNLQRNTDFSVAFHAYLSNNLVTTLEGGIIGFNHVAFNDGAGFTHGVFRAPRRGIYIIVLNVILSLKSHVSYSGWEQPVNVTLRVNKRPTHFSFQQPFVENLDGVTNQISAVVKLDRLSVVDAYAFGVSKFSIGNGSSLCGALI